MRGMFREDEAAVGDDVEDTALARNEVGINAEFSRNRGRQPDGLRTIVSTNAVADTQIHVFDHSLTASSSIRRGLGGAATIEHPRFFVRALGVGALGFRNAPGARAPQLIDTRQRPPRAVA